MTFDWAKLRQEVVDQYGLEPGRWYDVTYRTRGKTVRLAGIKFYGNGIYGLEFTRLTKTGQERQVAFDGTEIDNIELVG